MFDNDRTLRCEADADADPARLHPAPAWQSSIQGDHSCLSGHDESDERSGPLGYLIFTVGLGIGDSDVFDLGGIVGAVIGVVILLPFVGIYARLRRRSRGD